MINLKNPTITELINKVGNQIYYGPFSGLKIPEILFDQLTVPEVLGLYESCLFETWGKIAGKAMENIMIIGGHTGYYSASMSYLLQPKNNYTFETNLSLHHFISAWFSTNDLVSPKLYGAATEVIFKNWEDRIDLIICDCEGEEMNLLNPNQFQWQKATDIVVEIHPFYKEKALGELISRFKQTHQVNIIYDDFDEDTKITKILSGLGLQKLKYDKHPTHRWIHQKGKKMFTSGIFLYLDKL
ncbi:hypothetical protein [Pedobacter zeae]|uniref:Methyltransferase FkbM domain-containing protein n=1 Tax=Pedobacter zeae TaxID=1737356 RepID=A0A7W6K9Q9_9SPHI|nr:hypothetical protein [Pedobacter zeae]MBB4107808.1 hypothetical protein [Pedobacter zeae]GGG96887.1 hypothetical protein GCM10007422_08480 [Pedobacter zeae]